MEPSRFLGEGVLIILDTHIFIWLAEKLTERIPTKIRSAIAANSVLGVSAISLWEIAMLVDKGRVILSLPLLSWFKAALAAPKITLLPITVEVAARSGSLPIHGDPADRLIAATAIEHDCFLATLDVPLRQFSLLKTIVIP
jgi:PIN domain nuclease of toxin-antitoxin system